MLYDLYKRPSSNTSVWHSYLAGQESAAIVLPKVVSECAQHEDVVLVSAG